MRQSSSTGVTASLGFKATALLLLVAVAACEPMERTALTVDCSAESDIEYNVPKVRTPEDTSPQYYGFAWEEGISAAVGDKNFYCFADPTIDAYPTTAPWPSLAGCPLPLMEPIEGGGFCQHETGRHQSALHIRAGNHLFWGGTYGNWNFAVSGVSAKFPMNGVGKDLPADGIAFWARREIGSDNQITVYLNDEKTSDTGGACMPAESTEQQGQQAAAAAAVDPNVQTNNGATQVVKDPTACGNRWRAELLLEEDWQLIKMPFSSFYKEEVQPNRGTELLAPTKFYSLQFSFLRGQTLSVWLDEMGLYRDK